MDEELSTANSPPAFADPAGRIRSFPLKWPVILNGRTYSEIVLARLTVKEVAEFYEKLKSAPKTDDVAWPIYRDAEGAPLPQAVLDALEDDDGFKIEMAVRDFLPARLRAALDGASAQEPTTLTDNSSAGQPAGA